MGWLFTPTIKPGFSKKTSTFWSGPWTVVREVNPLFYEIKPHPTWVRQKNEFVTIDRLKKFQCHESDDEGMVSQPPPADLDLGAPGDEFLENFEVGGDDDEEFRLLPGAAPRDDQLPEALPE